MTPPDDEGAPIAYTALKPGAEVVSSDAQRVGVVESVIDNARENIFDGLVVRTEDGLRFVDAPEVARIAERRVTLSLDAAQAAQLGPYEPGAPTFRADASGGRLRRMLGGGPWRRS